MSLAKYRLLGLGLGGALALCAAAIATPADARAPRPYRCCAKVCVQWDYLRNSIGARCVRYERQCQFTVNYRACIGRQPR